MSSRPFFWAPLPPPFSGPEIACELLVNACRQHEPNIIVRNATLRASNMSKGRFDLGGVTAFARAYRRFIDGTRGADVVILPMGANAVSCVRDAILVLSARALRKRVVIHLRGGRYGEYYQNSNALMQWLLRLSWGSASRAIVETPRLARALEHAAPDVPISVLPNGLPSEMFPAKQTYSSAYPRLLFVGNLIYPKGFYDLMHAFLAARRRWPTAVLSCAGELPTPEKSFASFLSGQKADFYLRERQRICDDIRHFVKSDGVEYAGVVSGVEKQRLFTSADFLILPSYTEGFSVAILEAMFHGLPVITSTAGGSPDVIRHGRNGLLVRAGDVTELTDALETLMSDERLRERMGRLNAAEARERYEIDAVARTLTELLRHV